MEVEASIYELGIALVNERLELTQRRHPGVDSPIHKTGMCEDHQPNVPSYVEIAAVEAIPTRWSCPLDGEQGWPPLKSVHALSEPGKTP